MRLASLLLYRLGEKTTRTKKTAPPIPTGVTVITVHSQPMKNYRVQLCESMTRLKRFQVSNVLFVKALFTHFNIN